MYVGMERCRTLNSSILIRAAFALLIPRPGLFAGRVQKTRFQAPLTECWRNRCTMLQKNLDVSRVSLAGLERKLMHEFRDKRLLVQAMLHKSCSEHQIRLESEDGEWLQLGTVGNNERCEWLGDRVVGLYISYYLYRTHPEQSEGNMSKLVHGLVSRDYANELCIKLQLHTHLVSDPESNLAGPDQVPTPARFGNFLESCFGALFADGGDAAVRRFFDFRVVPLLDETMHSSPGIPRNYRSELQEILLLNGFETEGLGTKLQFRDLKPGSDPYATALQSQFWQSIHLYDSQVAVGSGQTKVKAAQDASRSLLEHLENTNVAQFLHELEAKSRCV